MEQETYDYDLIVIGGGSGGVACAKEAQTLGAHACVFDYVTPSPYGSKWGLGGTCVNVGCIPKKLMHQSAIIGELIEDAKFFGWDVPKVHHYWNALVNNVQDHIRGLNYQYRLSLKDKHVEYKNMLAKFRDTHSVIGVDSFGVEKKFSAKYFVVATGGRPSPLDCPGAEFAISSDDLFMLDHPPGKTLVVGASFVALECAGFLNALGFDVTVIVRSILLRGFDRECSDKIGEFMEEHGVKFIRESIPSKIEKLEGGKLKVFYIVDNVEIFDIYDTVIGAIGRTASTKNIGLDKVGVKAERNGKLKVVNEQTNIENIYAIGDVIFGRPELQPVARTAGILLAKRLFGGSTVQMDYEKIPMTVFTPIEYGNCGLTEEDAIAKYGEENIAVYQSFFTPLEWTISENRPTNKCYCKMICNKNDDLRVLGIHILSPNAGEIIQGWGISLQFNAKYQDMTKLIGIHPTVSEEFTLLKVAKGSGETAQKGGC